MTDRYHSLQVVLDEDVRSDDIESLIAAIAHFKGVIGVSGMVADPQSFMAEQRVRVALRKKLWDVVK
jgi:hypothetical protein